MTMEEMSDMSLFEGAADNADLLEKLLKASLSMRTRPTRHRHR